jgi:hypothetical protein
MEPKFFSATMLENTSWLQRNNMRMPIIETPSPKWCSIGDFPTRVSRDIISNSRGKTSVRPSILFKELPISIK